MLFTVSDLVRRVWAVEFRKHKKLSSTAGPAHGYSISYGRALGFRKQITNEHLMKGHCWHV